MCLVKGTLITLADRTTKPAEDVTYEDELLVWDFDNGEYGTAKPLWIKQPEIAPYYYRLVFDDNSILEVVGNNRGDAHRLFAYCEKRFIYATELVGKKVYTEDGVKRLMACERIDVGVEFYNVITDYHINLFSGRVLTSCRLNNLYTIDKEMKFIKDDRKIVPRESFSDISERYYDGLRLGEQKLNIDVIKEYIARMLRHI